MRRRFENWSNPTGEYLFGLTSYKIHQWEYIAGRSWRSYRKRLAEISKQSLASYPVIGYEDILNVEFNSMYALNATFKDNNLSDDDFILPLDDDDWYSEGITAPPNCDMFEWNVMVFQTADHCNFHYWRDNNKKMWCSNYAVRVGVLRQLPPKMLARILFHHEYASRYTVELGLRHVSSNVPLNVYLWHAGSTSAIRNNYVMSSLRIPPLPKVISWAKPYYDQFVELYKTLKHRNIVLL